MNSKTGFFLILLLAAGLFWADAALANKASVSIDAPTEVAKGSEITIRLTVTHSANYFFHHVEWVQVIVNNNQVAWGEYSFYHLPEGATYTKEIKYIVNDDTEIKAEASCNLHGSAGPTSFKVSTKENK